MGPNVTSDTLDVNYTLEFLNTEQAQRIYPVIIYIGMGSLTGVIGNSLVFYVYAFHYRRSPANVFITMLSVFDLINCAVALPFEIVDLLYPYLYGRQLIVPCKIFRSILAATVGGSGLSLMCIAYERYRKICTPLNLFHTKEAKFIIATCVVGSLCMGLPNLYIMGFHTDDTRIPHIKGTDCSVADSVRGTSFYLVYTVALLLTFLMFFTMYSYFYLRIGITLWKRKHLRDAQKRSFYKSRERDGSDYNMTPMGRSNDYPARNYRTNHYVSQNRNPPAVSRITGGVHIRTTRLTFILFLVTVVCVLSFLPNMLTEVLMFVYDWDFTRIYDAELDLILEFLNKSYVLNSCINPVIYNILNPPFRRQCGLAFGRLMRSISFRRQKREDVADV